MSKIKVVIYSPGFDTGGQGYRLKRAFDRHYPDEFEVRSIHTSNSYFKYPADIQYRARDYDHLFREADVIHMRNGVEDLAKLYPEAQEGKVGLICHWHGTRFRESHETLWNTAAKIGAIQLVSTVDLALLEPGLIWLPSPVDLQEMQDVKYQNTMFRTNPEGIHVAHAPTNRAVKSTVEIMFAVSVLAKKGMNIALDLIEKRPWLYTLQRKALSDIYFDQLGLGYGNNALEAWAMGQPVIAGVTDPLVRTVMLQMFGDLPFYEAASENLIQQLDQLANNQAAREWSAKIGLDHVRRFHEEKVVADQLAGLYRRALERKVSHARGH